MHFALAWAIYSEAELSVIVEILLEELVKEPDYNIIRFVYGDHCRFLVQAYQQHHLKFFPGFLKAETGIDMDFFHKKEVAYYSSKPDKNQIDEKSIFLELIDGFIVNLIFPAFRQTAG